MMSQYTVFLAQWEETQRKTYTKWVNMYLAKRKPPVKLDDVIEDFKKGPERICELLELLCGIKIDMEGGKLPGQATSRFHQINIVQNALDTLQQSKPDIKLIGISSSDIIDGKPAIVLGFVWKMVLNFQVSLGLSSRLNKIIDFKTFCSDRRSIKSNNEGRGRAR